MLGKVKWYSDPRGFGLIESEDGREIFFNRTAVEFSGFIDLPHDTKVEFDLIKKGKSEQAVNLHVLY